MKISFSRLAAGLFLALLLGACFNSNSTKKAEKPIKIGVILPLTGQFGAYGIRILDGIELRIKEVNQSGGIQGKKVKLVIANNAGKREKTIKVFRSMVEKDKVAVVIGAHSSTNTLALKTEAKILKVPVITPSSTNDVVTERNPYIFRSCFTDSFQGKTLAKYLYDKLKIRKVAVIYDVDEDGYYSRGLAKSFMETFEKAGGKVAVETGFHRTNEDYRKIARKAVDAGVQAIFIPGHPREISKLIKAAKEEHFKGLLCGGDTWDTPEMLTMAGPGIEGGIFTSMFSPEEQRPEVKEFVRKMMKFREYPPGTWEAQGYDTAALLIKALSDGSKPEQVKLGLLGISSYHGVTGNISINQNGDAIKPIVIEKIVRDKNGRLDHEFLDRVEP